MTDSQRPALPARAGPSSQAQTQTPVQPPQPPLPLPLPQELEARIVAFENAAPTRAFDLTSWLWMLALGVALPVALLAVGWWA